MKKIEKIILTALVFALSLIPFLWFKGDQLLLGYDNIYPLNSIAFLKDRIFSWSSIQGLGLDQSGQQGSIIVHFIDSIPQFLGLSAQISQKIVFSFWFFLLLASAYLFILSLEKNGFIRTKYLRYIFPVLYAVNFYVLQAWWIAERTKFSLLVATPLILALIIPFMKGNLTKKIILKKSIVCALILAVFNGGGWGGLSLYGGFLLTILSFYLFNLFSFICKKNLIQAVYLSAFFVFFGILFFLLNAYTFLPFLFVTFKDYSALVESAGGATGLIGWTRYISADTGFLNLLRFQGIPDWYNSDVYHPYSLIYLKNNFFIFLSFLFPAGIFLSFLFNRKKNREIMSLFAFLLLVSLFFTAGAHAPFGFIYELFMQKIPGFVIFRSSLFKFGYAYWFSASFLFGVFLSIFLEKIILRFKKISILSLTLPLFVIAALVSYHFPFLTGDIFRIDKSDVSSRVKIPSYAYDFSNWWHENGGTSKVLLLPKANDNWLFEQYRWKYLSLFSLLGNFANTGIVENTDRLTQRESNLVNILYASIANKNYSQMDGYSSMLGIDYFLVRKDFYYDISGQETENPRDVEEKLKANPEIEFVKSFGEWVLYRYKTSKPLFLATNKSSSIYGEGSSTVNLASNLLLLDGLNLNKYPFFTHKELIYPSCISCKAEKEEISAFVPKPKILMDSNLYDFIRLRDSLTRPKTESYDQSVFRIIGETLKNAGQISELVNQGKAEIFVNQAREKYVDSLRELKELLKEVEQQSQNPYSTIVIVEQYLDTQDNFLNDLLQRSSIKSEQISIELVLYEINDLNDRLRKNYGENDFNLNKYYGYKIDKPKRVEIKILRNSLGLLESNDLSRISIKLDNQEATNSPHLDGDFLAFGTVSLEEGNHLLRLNLPDQKNLISYTKQEKIAGSNCFSSYVENFRKDLVYNISFSSKNNFDQTLLYFVDGGIKYFPAQIGYLSISGEQISKERIIVSQNRVNIGENSNLLRISFCARSLTQSLYQENIKDLKVVFLTDPEVILENELENNFTKILPRISFVKQDQTRYKVFVKDAVDPFVLFFTQRYSDGWVSSVGEHIRGERFANAWTIDKKGSYTIDIYYQPQKYFKAGFIISVLSLISLGTFLYLKRRKDE